MFDAALFDPEAGVHERVGHRHQRRRTVDHRRVDDLTLPARARREHRGEDAEDQEQRTPAEVPDEIERRHWAIALRDRSARARPRPRCS